MHLALEYPLLPSEKHNLVSIERVLAQPIVQVNAQTELASALDPDEVSRIEFHTLRDEPQKHPT